MVIDKGLGLHAFEDVLNVSAAYMDVYKLAFGTSVLYPTSLLQRKIALARMHRVQIMPGGTFFEVAYMSDAVESYIATIKSLGFTAIEISDGSLLGARSGTRATTPKGLWDDLSWVRCTPGSSLTLSCRNAR